MGAEKGFNSPTGSTRTVFPALCCIRPGRGMQGESVRSEGICQDLDRSNTSILGQMTTRKRVVFYVIRICTGGSMEKKVVQRTPSRKESIRLWLLRKQEEAFCRLEGEIVRVTDDGVIPQELKFE